MIFCIEVILLQVIGKTCCIFQRFVRSKGCKKWRYPISKTVVKDRFLIACALHMPALEGIIGRRRNFYSETFVFLIRVESKT
jgi:hypothetical protein